MSGGAAKLFSFVGAGYAGALLCNNVELATEFAGKLGRSVLHSLAAKSDAGGALSGSSSDESLRRLTAEVAALAALVSARGSSLAAAHGSSSNNALIFGGVAFSGAALLHMRGLGVDNLLYVSRASFRQGVSTLGAGLQSVSTALARVRTALSERIDALGARVAEVGTSVEATARGVESLGEQLDGMSTKLDGVSSKQDFACRGVFLLCSAVSQALNKDGGSAGSNDTSKKLQEMLAAPSCETGSAPLMPLTGSLQEQLAAISSLAARNMAVGA